MPPSAHLPLVDRTLGLQLIAAGASISTTAKLLRVTETTARALKKSLTATAEGRQAGHAVREAFAAAYGSDDNEAWVAVRRVAAEVLGDRLAELPPGRGRPV